MSSAFDHLREAVERRASGELICATRRSEVHVHVQKGRVAWATDSERPHAFTRHLIEHGRITREDLQEVLRECRRTRAPLGERLVSWGLATADQVRDALRHQIRIALETLLRHPDARALFLERSYSDYDPGFTFEFASLVGAMRAGSEWRPPAGAGEPPGVEGVLERFREVITEAHWLERLDGEALVERYPPGPVRSEVPRDVLRHTLLDGADFVALRASGTTLLGAAFPAAPSSVWICLAEDGAFGSAYSEMSNLVGLTERGHAAVEAAADVLRDDAAWAPLREAPWSQFLASAPEALAVFVGGAGAQVAGIARDERVGRAALALVRRRTPALAAGTASAPPGRRVPGSSRDLGASPTRLVTGEPGLWCFASELDGAGALWLATDRSCPQGLGWAYLQALTRTAAGAGRGGGGT